MRTPLEKAHDISSIGTFVLTIVIVAIMVIPMLWPSQTPPKNPSAGSKPMIGWVMPSVLVVCILLAGILNLLAARERNKTPDRHQVVGAASATPVTSTSTPVASPAALGPHRVPTNATPAELHKIWEQNTSVQAKKLSEIYIGTWMTISGSVSNVRTSSAFDAKFKARNVMRVTVNESRSSFFVCEFEQQWAQRCSVLRKGDPVSVLGRVSDFDSTTITLEECEFT